MFFLIITQQALDDPSGVGWLIAFIVLTIFIGVLLYWLLTDEESTDKELQEGKHSSLPIDEGAGQDDPLPVPVPPPEERKLIEDIDLSNFIEVRKGGLGEVRIYDFPKKVVVKFPRTDSGPIDQRTRDYRLEREIEQHKKLQHENVVRFIEDGQCEHPVSKQETRYLMQEFVNGWTLKTIIKCRWHQPLDESRILRITSQILDALEYIHSQSVLHRDLSWENVMVDLDKRVYLIDFGNATTLYKDETGVIQEKNPDKQIVTVGTPPFAPPPDISKMPNTKAKDFYALAILIYLMYGGFCLTGTEAKEYRESVKENLKKMSNVPEHVKKTLNACLQGDFKDVSRLRKELQLPHPAQTAQNTSSNASEPVQNEAEDEESTRTAKAK